MHDLIFVSMENWDDIWRRNQFVCAGLCRRFPSLKILFVGLPRDVSHALRTGHFHDLAPPQFLHPQGFDNITFCRPLKFLPTTLAAGRALNDAVTRRTIRRWARACGLRQPILWLNPHYAVHLVGTLHESEVIYDITDDWTELTQSPAMRALTIQQDAELCRRADHVIVCSQRLFEAKQGLARSLHLIPNGVDVEHYRPVADRAAPLPASVAHLPRPVLGYTGTIHPDRIDMDLIVQLAGSMKHGSILLIGPDMLPESDRRRLGACPNVLLHPAVAYQDVPNYMRAFDVCITPHRVTPFTESLNPIKLWEYLATGKPIIATPVAGFRDFPQHVYLAGAAEGFVHAVSLALAEPPARAAARQAAAQQHTWDERIARIAALLEDRNHLVPLPQETAA